MFGSHVKPSSPLLWIHELIEETKALRQCSTASRVRRRTLKSTPNRPISQTCRGLAVQVPADAVQVDLRLDALALGAHLDGALKLRFQLRAGRAGRGSVAQSCYPRRCLPRRAPSCGDLVRCKADAHALRHHPEITGLPENFHGAVAAAENFFTVLSETHPPLTFNCTGSRTSFMV